VNVISTFLFLLELLIFARVAMSWFVSPLSRHPVVEFVRGSTEPILAPIRSLLPRTGMFDLSPMIAIFALSMLRSMLGH
jgi:YggT family protein